MRNNPLPQVEKFESSSGLQIYRLQVEAFPRFMAFCYLLLGGDVPVLVDVGSGWANSNSDLQSGFEVLKRDFGVAVGLADIGKIVITHGHIDHFGGLAFVKELTAAPVAVHVLDRRVLSNFEERVVVAAKGLRVFLRRAGLNEAHLANMMEMYAFGKGYYRSVAVDETLEDGQTVAGLQVWHVPGHCPGQIMLQAGDVMFTADHILAGITPHQSPESITRSTGLGHYFESLTKAKAISGVRLALGGHKAPLYDYYGRIDEIRAAHDERLEKVLDLCQTPQSISDVSRGLFGKVEGYNVLLALEEAGAHVEYLYQRGALEAANLKEIESEDEPTILYQRT